jgi:hypothetical protein
MNRCREIARPENFRHFTFEFIIRLIAKIKNFYDSYFSLFVVFSLSLFYVLFALLTN